MTHDAGSLGQIYPEELLEPHKGLNIREFWNTISRNRKLLFTFTALACLISLLLTLFMKPVYRASSTIQIEHQSPKMVDLVFESTGRRSERDFWSTQIQLLQSNALASTVMDDLDIRDRFQSAPGFLAQFRSAPPTPEANFLKGLYVEPLSNSQLIMVHYESGDPELSSQIVNKLAETYIRSNLERQFENAKYTQEFLQQQQEDVKKRLADSEKALNQFARDNSIIDMNDNQTTNAHILKKLAEEMIDAERQAAALDNELSQLEGAAASDDPSSPIVTPEFQNLRNKIATLKDDYADTSYKFGPNSRKARRLKRNLDAAEQKLVLDTKSYKSSLASRLKSAKRSEVSLKEKLESLRKETVQVQEQLQHYNNLKREVNSNQTLYHNLVERIKEVGVAGGMDTNNITVIDKAITPTNKFKPKIKTNLAFGTLMGFLLGIAFVFLRDFMDDSIKTAQQLEDATRLPMLGAIPQLKGRNRKEIAQQILTEPRSIISESIRSLRTALSFATENGAPKILFFTSSEAEEGKTSIALNLASAYALAGEKVLLIDADLRNPSLNELLKLDNRQGLSNYLTGKGDLSVVAQRTSVNNLNAIVSGPLPPDPVELLSGHRIKELLETTRDSYDRIIIDGPPVLGLADALILANIADGTLLAVHAEKTRKAPIQTSLKRLRQARAHIIGTLLNQATKVGSGYSYLKYESNKPPQTDDNNPAVTSMYRS